MSHLGFLQDLQNAIILDSLSDTLLSKVLIDKITQLLLNLLEMLNLLLGGLIKLFQFFKLF